MTSDPSQLNQFIGWFVLIAFPLYLIWFGVRWYRKIKQGIVWRRIPGEVLYREYTASGRSQHGEVENCLKLIVTPTELWTTSWFPFILFIDKQGLEHRIPKSKITKVTLTQSSLYTNVLIDFLTEGGAPNWIEILSRHHEKFIKALDLAGKVPIINK